MDDLSKAGTFELSLEQGEGAVSTKTWVKSIESRENSKCKEGGRNRLSKFEEQNEDQCGWSLTENWDVERDGLTEAEPCELE